MLNPCGSDVRAERARRDRCSSGWSSAFSSAVSSSRSPDVAERHDQEVPGVVRELVQHHVGRARRRRGRARALGLRDRRRTRTPPSSRLLLRLPGCTPSARGSRGDPSPGQPPKSVWVERARCRPRRAARRRRRRRRRPGVSFPSRSRTVNVPASRSRSPTTSVYGAFISCAARIFLPTDSFESSTNGRSPASARAGGELLAVLDVAVGDRDEADLLGRQPQRERAGVVLDQHGAEPLERAEDRAVDHDRPVTLVVVARVLHVEPLGQREVALHGGELPQRGRSRPGNGSRPSVRRRCPHPRPPCTAGRSARAPSRAPPWRARPSPRPGSSARAGSTG